MKHIKVLNINRIKKTNTKDATAVEEDNKVVCRNSCTVGTNSCENANRVKLL